MFIYTFSLGQNMASEEWEALKQKRFEEDSDEITPTRGKWNILLR